MPTVALPPKARAVCYLIFSCLGLGLGATQVGYAAANQGQPTWLTVALAVYAFLGVGLGFTAASNTQTAPSPTVTVESGYVSVEPSRTVDLTPPETGADGVDDTPRRGL